MRLSLCVLCGLLVLPAAAYPKVKMGVGAQGRTIIFNEGVEFRSRRMSDPLVPIPSADLQPLIDQHSTAQNLDPKLVRAVIQVESGYNQRARSNKGAMGLMQLIRATADHLSVADPYDPDQNLRGGTTYLRRMIDRFGSVELALAAYNAGPEAVARYNGIPPYRETVNYVKRILSMYRGEEVAVSPSTRTPSSSQLAAGPAAQKKGAKTFLVRENGRLVVTTASQL